MTYAAGDSSVPDSVAADLANHEAWIEQLWSAVLWLQGKIPGADADRRKGSLNARRGMGQAVVAARTGKTIGPSAHVAYGARVRSSVGMLAGCVNHVSLTPHYRAASAIGKLCGLTNTVVAPGDFFASVQVGKLCGLTHSVHYAAPVTINSQIGKLCGPTHTVSYSIPPINSTTGLEKGLTLQFGAYDTPAPFHTNFGGLPPMVPNAGLLDDLTLFLAGIGTLNVHLAGATWTPAPGDTPPPTTETGFNGYAAQSPAFGAPFVNGSNQAEADSGTLVFTSTGGGSNTNVYGYWIDNGTDIIGEELFSGGPYDMSINGATLTLNIAYLVGSM